ncbi:MAG: hypothetical protein IPG93_15140 [Burkholderiales bacterium]|nr:hypothetical protein [Burkholderiales bacterium]
MSIEWGITGLTSNITHSVVDNSPNAPDVLRAGAPFNINVAWQVPAALASLIGPGDSFRLRAYAESIGPGQEMQIGQPLAVPGVMNALNYTATVQVNPNPLLGEEQLFGGQPVSGCYNIVVVLQHLNGGAPTVHSGCSDNQPPVMFRFPA